MKLTANGYIQTTVVTGTTLTGLFAADGSVNIVIVPGTSVVGRYHACGALNVVIATTTSPVPLVHASGALNVVIGSVVGSVTHPSGALQVSNAVPTFVPSLDGIFASFTVNFGQDKSWASNVESTASAPLTITRATTTSYGRDSSGTWVPYSANTLRFDQVVGGVIIEPGSTNLCLQSSDLSSVLWIKAADVTITANSTVGIFGTQTADTITADGTSRGDTYQSIVVSASTTYTWSFYAKLGTMAASNFKFAVYDFTNAAFIGVNLVPSVTLTSTSWTKVSYTFTTPVGCVLVRPFILRNGTANASGTVFIDHCQLEALAFDTSPIPTTATSASRATDVLSYSLPASLQSAAAYTVAWEGVYNTNHTSNQFAAWLNDGTTSNLVNLYKAGSTNVATLSRTPPGGGQSGLVAISPGVSVRLAAAATDNDIAMLQTGQAARTATGAGFPTGINKLNIGSYNAAAFGQNGVCKQISLWPSRRTNAALAGWVG